MFPGSVICFGFMRVSLGLPDPLPAHEQFPNPFVKIYMFFLCKTILLFFSVSKM